ncbi:MAG: hypothetical protein HS116_01300 [Planctomycetes bacterium]|nr:hypothetical protein [Planctomycetota bacterium]
MIERLVGNWLTNCSERGFEVPYCQLLNQQGFKVVHLTRHGPYEQGKDILAISPEGKPAAFQLKGVRGARLTLTAYREMKAQITDLVEQRVTFPGISRDAHRPYLVLTGHIDEQVRRDIDDSNRDRWNSANGFENLIVKTLPCLEQEFVQVFKNNQPTFVNVTKDIIQTWLSDGTDILDKKRFSEIIDSLLDAGSRPNGEQAAIEKVSCASAICGVALSPYWEARNHWALIEGLVLVWCYVYSYAERYGINSRNFDSTLKILEKEIDYCLECLAVEATEEKSWLSVSLAEERCQRRAVKTIVLGCMCAHRVIRRMQGVHELISDREYRFVLDGLDKLFLWGESAIPFMLSIHWWGGKFSGSQKFQLLLAKCIYGILQANSRSLDRGRSNLEDPGLASPYYGVEEVLLAKFGDKSSAIEEEFIGSSYSLEALVHLFAPLLWKRHLKVYWPEITRTKYCRFVPEERWQLLTWRCLDGKLETREPGHLVRFSDLIIKSENIDSAFVPMGLSERPHMALLYLLVFPHRINVDLVLWLNQQVKNSEN